MLKAIIDFFKSIFSKKNIKINNQKVINKNSPNSTIINGNNNKVVKGQKIEIEESTLVIKDEE